MSIAYYNKCVILYLYVLYQYVHTSVHEHDMSMFMIFQNYEMCYILCI